MKHTVSIFRTLVIIGLLVLLLASCGPGFVKTPTPPVPAPTPALDAGVIAAQAISEIAIDSAASDRETAHATPTPEPTLAPSNEVQIGRAWGTPGAIALVGICGFSVLGMVAALLILAWDRRTTLLAQMNMDELKRAPEWPKGSMGDTELLPPPSG